MQRKMTGFWQKKKNFFRETRCLYSKKKKQSKKRKNNFYRKKEIIFHYAKDKTLLKKSKIDCNFCLKDKIESIFSLVSSSLSTFIASSFFS